MAAGRFTPRVRGLFIPPSRLLICVCQPDRTGCHLQEDVNRFLPFPSRLRLLQLLPAPLGAGDPQVRGSQSPEKLQCPRGFSSEPSVFPALPLCSFSQFPHEAPPGHSTTREMSPALPRAPPCSRNKESELSVIPNYPGSHPWGPASSFINKHLDFRGHPAFPHPPPIAPVHSRWNFLP